MSQAVHCERQCAECEVRFCYANLAEYGAWVISDVSGLRQRLLQVQQLGPVVAVFHDLHPKCKFNQLVRTTCSQ